MKQGTIELKCSGTLIPIEDLKNLQGNLKSLSQEAYIKLRKTLSNDGFTFVLHVWKDPDPKAKNDYYLIDGHQRLFALKRMASEGYTIPTKLPCSVVDAPNISEARKRVLLASSAYGKMDESNLYNFLQEIGDGITWDEIRDVIDLRDINMPEFEEGYISDPGVAVQDNRQPPPSAVELTIKVDNASYSSFVNQLNELMKKFPMATWENKTL